MGFVANICWAKMLGHIPFIKCMVKYSLSDISMLIHFLKIPGHKAEQCKSGNRGWEGIWVGATGPVGGKEVPPENWMEPPSLVCNDGCHAFENF